MKTYTILGIMLVFGKQKELESVDKLAAGTHFLTAYGNRRGGKRKIRGLLAPGPRPHGAEIIKEASHEMPKG
jgi:hypothetical protein